MATTCPENENSTDCLLRALLQFTEDEAHTQDSKFDWDPITFAFTVPIGLLAAVFSLILICQTVLASGPGRRKSSTRTIGQKWASKTTKEWNWHDFNVVSIARTPVLRSRRIQEVLEKLLSSPETTPASTPKTQSKGSSVATWLTGILKKHHLRSPRAVEASSAFTTDKQPGESPPATWLRLLQQVGLQDLDLGDDDLEITAADYLADDILAVPAYADLGLIVAVAAAAGAHSFRTQSESVYPIIIGDGFQFDFRQHPALGNVGAFSKYGGDKKAVKPLTTQEIVLALRHSRGDIDIGPSFLLDSTTTPEAYQKEEFNILSPFYPGRILLMLTSHECKERSALYRDAEEHSWTGVTDEHHLLWLFLARLPDNIPATFPSKQSNFLSVLQMLALNSPFWSSATGSDWNDEKWLTSFYGTNGLITSSRSPPQQPNEDDLVELSELFLQNKEMEAKEGWDNNDTHPSANWEHYAWSKNQPILYTYVCEKSAKFLYTTKDFMAEFDNMTINRKRYFRFLILLQLQDVDRRLKCANVKGAVSCHIFSLYYTTLALLDSERAMKDNSFGVSKSEAGQKSGWSVLNVENGPRNNLIVRRFAILKSLGSFFDTLDPLQLGPGYHRLQNGRQFHSIFKSQLSGFRDLSFGFKWEFKVLLHLKMILDTSYNTIEKSDWVQPPTLSAIEARVPDPPGKSREHGKVEADSTRGREKLEGWKQLDKRFKDEERLCGHYNEIDWRQVLKRKGKQRKKNVGLEGYTAAPLVPKEWELDDIANHIIFRSILLCLLFCTAPDTSDMLSSGLWEHVIPII